MRDKSWWSWSVWLLTLEQQKGGRPSHKSEQSDRRAQSEAGDHLLLGLPGEVRPRACAGRAGRAGARVVCTACSGLQFQLPVSLAVSEDRPRRCLCSPALHVLGGEGFGRGWGSSYILRYAHTLSLFLLQGVNDHLSTEKGQPLLGAGGGWSAFPAFKETSYTPTVCQRVFARCRAGCSLPCMHHLESLWGCKSCPCVLGAPA